MNLLKAINQSNPSFFLNRAKCYKELHRFEEMLQDAAMAIELDDLYIKAFIVLGEAFVEVGKNEPGVVKIDKGIQKLRRAYSLCTGQDVRRFEQDIQRQILKAQKIRWYKINELETDEKAFLIHDLKKKLKTQRDLMHAYMP